MAEVDLGSVDSEQKGETTNVFNAEKSAQKASVKKTTSPRKLGRKRGKAIKNKSGAVIEFEEDEDVVLMESKAMHTDFMSDVENDSQLEEASPTRGEEAHQVAAEVHKEDDSRSPQGTETSDGEIEEESTEAIRGQSMADKASPSDDTTSNSSSMSESEHTPEPTPTKRKKGGKGAKHGKRHKCKRERSNDREEQIVNQAVVRLQQIMVDNRYLSPGHADRDNRSRRRSRGRSRSRDRS